MKSLPGMPFSLLVASLLFLSGCGGTANTINVDGSSTVYLITAAVNEEFSAKNGDIQVAIQISGTGGGMKKFTQGTIDVCNASRKIKDSEIKECEANGIEFVELKVAYDGIAVMVNPKNDFVDDMTTDQLKELWRPESPIKKWKDINPDWPDQEIALYGPDHDSGTFEYFTDKIVEEKNSSREDYQANANDNSLASQIANDENALGYFGFAYYIQNVDKLKLIAVNGNKPSKETIQSLEYSPLSRPLFVYVNKKSLKRPDVQKFMSFYLANCEELSERVGYVRLKADEQKASEDALSAATSAGSGE